jgi:hypothetical protein
MRALRTAILLLAGAMLCSATEVPLSLPEYISELKQLRQAVSSAIDSNATTSIEHGLPEEWRVRVEGQEFAVPLYDLKVVLNEYSKQRTTSNRNAAISRLDLMLSDACAMQSVKADFSSEHKKLAEILSRREFHNVEDESWWEKIKRAVQRWIWSLIERILLSSAYPVISRVVIWGLVAVAVAAAAYWIVRNYREKNTYTHFSGAPDIVSARPWRDWQAEAQAAAQEGRWRDAVHLSYWAAISFLEAQGLWRPDVARTPREYLRLLPAADRHRYPLQQLTHSFEKVWYGNDEATAETFAGASTLLEQIGCR